MIKSILLPLRPCGGGGGGYARKLGGKEGGGEGAGSGGAGSHLTIGHTGPSAQLRAYSGHGART